MKVWIMITIVMALLITASIVVVYATSTEEVNKQSETIDSPDCENSCTANRNCGLASCGARAGRSCGCGG